MSRYNYTEERHSDKVKQLDIVFIETAMHFEVVRSYALTFASICRSVTCIVNQKVYEFNIDLKTHENIHWQIIDNTPSDLENKRQIIQQSDLAIYTTLNADSRKFIVDNVAKYVVLHTIHQYFEPWENFDFNVNPLKSFVKGIRSLVGNGNQSLNSFDGFILGSKFMKEYIATKPYFNAKRFLVFPFSLHEKTRQNKEAGDTIRITIPGTVSQNSRDYKVVLKVFQQFKTNRKIALYFAGRIASKREQKIIDAFKNIDLASLTIHSFDHIIDNETYNRILSNSDFLICPIKQFTQYGFSLENNGLSQVSGNINDIIKHGIPSILPAYYPIYKSLNPVIKRYQNAEDLRAVLNQLINQDQYINLKEEGNTIFPKFDLENRSILFKAELLKLLNY